MRVLVSVDMEGVAGVVHGDDVRPGHPEYERNRRYMTGEANAAVRGVLAYDADATVIVADSHAGFRNLLPHELDRRCTLVRGKPRRLARPARSLVEWRSRTRQAPAIVRRLPARAGR